MKKIEPSPIHEMPFTRIELVVLSIVDGQLAVLLGKRSQAPHQNQWALPGGVLRIDLDDDLDAAAQRIGIERLNVKLPNMTQLKAVGSKLRDPRAPWALSIAVSALIPLDAIDPNPGKRLEALKWVCADTAAADPSLAFDHASLIELATKTIRKEVDRLEFPPGFLPEMFTLGELQLCCEYILDRPLDKSSFRRRLSERGLLEEVVGEMRTGAFRPAQLYRLAPFVSI